MTDCIELEGTVVDRIWSDNDYAAKRGRKLADLLGLKPDPVLKGLYNTANGPKTLTGLARCALEALALGYRRSADMTSILYDDPQIHDEDWRAAAEDRIAASDDFELDADAVVSVGNDGAYVQVWLYVATEEAADKARNRQATLFNNRPRVSISGGPE